MLEMKTRKTLKMKKKNMVRANPDDNPEIS